jgi:DNA polymerase-3 subunit gamma/tau
METVPQPGKSASPVAEMERPAAQSAPEVSSFRATTPFPASPTPASGFASGETLTEGALARSPQTSVSAPLSLESLRHAIGCALVEGGHSSAAQLLGSGAWTLEPTSLRIDVAGMGKKMLSLTVNAAAEKIIRQELQRLGAPTRFLVVPGAAASGPVAAAPPPLAGSIQKAALEHPMVQRAKEVFKAEVRSVVDLRQK